MQKRYLTVILSGLLFSTIQPVVAENQATLSAEQIHHEKEMAELRKQKEILELKHSQAKLLRECHDLGIDCSGGSLEIDDTTNDDLNAEIESFNLPPGQQISEQSPFTLNVPGNDIAGSPSLEAIQNNSARFNYAGNTEWALVGDKVGKWVVTHIDATKVRIKHTGNANTKTLVLNW